MTTPKPLSADLPIIESFHLNAPGQPNVMTAEGDRFCYEHDVKAYKKAATALIDSLTTRLEAAEKAVKYPCSPLCAAYIELQKVEKRATEAEAAVGALKEELERLRKPHDFFPDLPPPPSIVYPPQK